MHFPLLKSPVLRENRLTAFGGLERREGCPDYCFSFTQNTSSDCYPYLSSRKQRLFLDKLNKAPSAFNTDLGLCYTVGNKVYYNGKLQCDTLSDLPKKQIVSMGSKLIIFPDGYYINTAALDEKGIVTDKGSITPVYEQKGAFISVIPCVPEDPMPVLSATPPDATEKSKYWLNTSVYPNVLSKYNADTDSWETITATHTALHTIGINTYAEVGRPYTVTAPGLEHIGTALVDAVDEDCIVVLAATEKADLLTLDEDTPITVKQALPVMDFVCEHNNRLFGCRYGTNVYGDFVNEIYASKLGSPHLWFEYEGLSTDSYAASCGSEGGFTGICSYLGNVIFFKENTIHRLMGTKPANFTLYRDPYSGIAKGSEDSLVIYDGTVYYHGKKGVYAYTGSSPALISSPLGDTLLTNAVCAAAKNKLYLCADHTNGTRHTYVYYMEKDIWHREDGGDFAFLSHFSGEVIGVIKTDTGYCITLPDHTAIPPVITNLFPTPTYESELDWVIESGRIGLNMEGCKRLHKITLRLRAKKDAPIVVEYCLDSGNEWKKGGVFFGLGLTSFNLPLNLPRCDHLKIRLSGKGEFTLYSLTKVIEEAGDRI